MKRTLLTLAALLLPVAPAIAGEVKIKNCTDERLLACSYDSSDGLMEIPFDVKGIGADKTKTVKCVSKKCRVFLGMSNKKKKDYTKAAVAGGGAVLGAAAGAEVVGAGFIVPALLGTAPVGSAAILGGGAVAAGVVVGSIKLAEGFDNGKTCKKIIKKAKQAKKQGLGKMTAKLKGKYTLQSATVDGQTYMFFEKGHNACK
ncbi:MAG: hypothetical protein KC613_03650 [Myxococcales bacterium]|nr:hypothetical protein [Myxococcales bacterium]MCB9524849.1 hypothetical protein [Myxococcales bacterium]